jgi:hypothetical protein
MAWLSGWANRVKLTVDHNDIDDALSNFPVLLYISTSSGRNSEDISFVFDELGSDANRKKIAVTTSDGETQCYVEIEKWDHANEQAWLWVKAPSISSGADTDFYLYYDADHADNTDYVGDPNSTPAESVWDSNFKFVSHMKDDPDTSHIRDSTANSTDGTKKGTNEPAEATGKISKAQDFDGDDDLINLGSIGSGHPLMLNGTDVTIEFWAKWDGNGDAYQRVVDKSTAGSMSNGYGAFLDLVNNFELWADGGRWIASVTGLSLSGAWHYYVLRAQAGTTTGNAYLDIVDKTGTKVARTIPNATANMRIGSWNHDDAREFKGLLDEIRISNVARSYAWIKATYETSRDHLLDWGSEETAPTAGWTGKISGVTNPAKVMGVDVANIAKVKGVT